MRRDVVWSAVAALLAVFTFRAALRADDPPKANVAPPVAVLNLDRLTKENPGIKAKFAKLREELEEFQKTAQLRQAELEGAVADIRKAPPNSGEAQKAGQKAQRLQAELQQLVQKEQQAFSKKEALIHIAFHRELNPILKKYCQEKGIKLVLRQQEANFSDDQPFPELAKAANRGILYDEGVDITDDLLKLLSAKAPDNK